MFALFLSGNTITGIKPDPTEDELALYTVNEYVLVDVLPPELESYQGTAIWNADTQTVTIEPLAPSPASLVAEKITKLEAENAALKQENIDTMLALTELYEMVLGGTN